MLHQYLNHSQLWKSYLPAWFSFWGSVVIEYSNQFIRCCWRLQITESRDSLSSAAGSLEIFSRFSPDPDTAAALLYQLALPEEKWLWYGPAACIYSSVAVRKKQVRYEKAQTSEESQTGKISHWRCLLPGSCPSIFCAGVELWDGKTLAKHQPIPIPIFRSSSYNSTAAAALRAWFLLLLGIEYGEYCFVKDGLQAFLSQGWALQVALGADLERIKNRETNRPERRWQENNLWVITPPPKHFYSVL